MNVAIFVPAGNSGRRVQEPGLRFGVLVDADIWIVPEFDVNDAWTPHPTAVIEKLTVTVLSVL